ncbi:MAG: hypothetical protein NVSMB68_04810 [Thermoanaerobaculia bacterium]
MIRTLTETRRKRILIECTPSFLTEASVSRVDANVGYYSLGTEHDAGNDGLEQDSGRDYGPKGAICAQGTRVL